jgi:hypothetical protein
MFKDAKEFVRDAAEWGMASWLAALVSFGIGIWEHFHGTPVSALILICLAVPLFWIGSYIAWAKKKRKLEHEQSLHGGPEISLSWDAVPPLNTRKTLFLENSGTIDAYQVKINDIGLNQTHCGARFPLIPKCQKGSRSAPSFELFGDGVPEYEKNNLEMIVYASQSDFQKDASGNPITEFPIMVTFEEYGCARYEAKFLFVADPDLSKVNIHRVSRQRILD